MNPRNKPKPSSRALIIICVLVTGGFVWLEGDDLFVPAANELGIATQGQSRASSSDPGNGLNGVPKDTHVQAVSSSTSNNQATNTASNDDPGYTQPEGLDDQYIVHDPEKFAKNIPKTKDGHPIFIPDNQGWPGVKPLQGDKAGSQQLVTIGKVYVDPYSPIVESDVIFLEETVAGMEKRAPRTEESLRELKQLNFEEYIKYIRKLVDKLDRG